VGLGGSHPLKTPDFGLRFLRAHGGQRFMRRWRQMPTTSARLPCSYTAD